MTEGTVVEMTGAGWLPVGAGVVLESMGCAQPSAHRCLWICGLLRKTA